jgi:hypothetical protein
MDISKDDYEQRRHIFDFCRWVNQKLYDLEQEADFETLYFERTGANWKKLLEEAIPVSRFGLYLYREWHEVFVQCFTNNSEYDAVIDIQSPSAKQHIKVEVTTTEDDESAMRRQALSRKGFVHFTGPVRREGRQIFSEGAFVDVEEECTKIVQLVLQRFERKLNNTYDDATVLLIYVATHRMLSHLHRFKLVEEVKRLLRERKPALYGVFICYSSNLGVDGIINASPYDFAV